MSVLSIGRMKSVPAAEAPWLADRFGALNTLFSLTMLAMVLLPIFLVARQRLWGADAGKRRGFSP